jgi:secreted PhoX family phosphatase
MGGPFRIARKPVSRRRFLGAISALSAQALAGSSLFTLGCDGQPVGELQPADVNGIRLPIGFRSRVVARSGTAVAGTGHVWHRAPDGGAVFATGDGGWIYVSNSELSFNGGVGALRFSQSGTLVDAYSICSGTRRNCAGGATPWGTWLTCEEVGTGLVYECDPFGRAAQIPRPALGTFNHEAVAFDPEGRAYLTEDRPDGRLYRFTPNAAQNLGSGVLEVLGTDVEANILWYPVPDANPAAGGTPTRAQVPQSYALRGGEGIDSSGQRIYFTTKGDNRVWELDLVLGKISIIYERQTDFLKHLSGVDNLVVASNGAIVVAEDGGNMELVLLSEIGVAVPLLRVEGQAGSELAGPAFDPSRTRLYFSSQRGTNGQGITYEIEGPFFALG